VGLGGRSCHRVDGLPSHCAALPSQPPCGSLEVRPALERPRASTPTRRSTAKHPAASTRSDEDVSPVFRGFKKAGMNEAGRAGVDGRSQRNDRVDQLRLYGNPRMGRGGAGRSHSPPEHPLVRFGETCTSARRKDLGGPVRSASPGRRELPPRRRRQTLRFDSLRSVGDPIVHPFALAPLTGPVPRRHGPSGRTRISERATASHQRHDSGCGGGPFCG